MSSYRGSGKQDRTKALAAVAIVHVALGAVILTGLDVRIVREAAERIQTFDVVIPDPPPPPPPPPPPKEVSEASDEGAPAAPKASPVVAPEPEIRLPISLPIAAAPIPGTGSTSSIGRGGRGNGTGAGGTGSGSGTGSGDGRGFTPAQRVARVPDSEYRRFVQVSGMSRGRVGVTVKVNTDGSPSYCRIVRSSGSPAADALMCELTLRHVRFRPARDPQGRPVAQDMSWFPDWSPNR